VFFSPPKKKKRKAAQTDADGATGVSALEIAKQKEDTAKHGAYLFYLLTKC